MAGYQELFDQYLAADPITNPEAFDTSDMPATKAATVARASAAKKAAMGAPNGYDLATMRATGSGAASASQRDRDFLSLTTNQFRQKYGNDIGAQYTAAASSGDSNRRQDLQDGRDGAQIIGDTLNTVVAAPVSLLGGLGAAGLGIADALDVAPEGSGVYASEQLGNFNRAMQDMQSREMNNARRAYQSEVDLQGRDTAQQAEIDEEAYGSVASGAIQIASDIKDNIATALKNPDMALDTVANTGGSLIGGGILSKGLQKIGSAVLSKAPTAIAGKVASVGSKASMPASIIGMEAGAAYQQTAEAAYSELIAAGVPHEEAVQRANKAALEAGAVQGGITAAIMPFTGGARFERAPVRVGSAAGALHTILGETVEEGIQEGSAQFSQNLGIQDFVDPNQSLTEGVGQGAALGMIGGTGSAAGLQSPGIALRGAIGTAKLPFKALSKGLTYAGERIEARNQKVQDDLLNGLYQQADAAREEALSEVEAIPDEGIRAKAQATIEKLANHPKMQEAAKLVRTKSADLVERLQALAGLSEMVSQSQEEQDTPTPEGMEKSVYQSIKDTVANAAQSVNVQAAMETGKKMFADVGDALNGAMKGAIEAAKSSGSKAPEWTEVQDNIPLLSSMAELTPEEVDPDVIDNINYHDEQGDITLTPKQRSTFRSASAVARAAQKGAELGQAYGLSSEEAVSVSRQVLTDPPKQGSKLSLNGHLQRIRTAYNSGDVEVATKLLGDLRSFAQHLSNKVVSFNDALAGGHSNPNNPLTGFPVHVGKGVFKPLGRTYIDPTKASNVKLAQHVAVQALVVGQAVNDLGRVLGLQVEHVTPANLDASLNGEADAVVEQYVSQRRKVPVEASSSADEGTGESAETNQADEPSQEVVEDTPEEEAEAEVEDEPNPDVNDSEQSETEVEPVSQEAVEPTQEKVPEVIEESSEPEAEPETPVLIGGERNRVAKALRQPKSDKIRLKEAVSPLQSVKDTLVSESTFTSAVGNLNRRYTKAVATAYATYLDLGDQIRSELDKRLQIELGKKLKRGLSEEQLLDFLEGGAFNLVVKNPDGSYNYDPKLSELAILAGLQWYLKMNNHGAPVSDQDVRDMFGLPAETYIPARLAESLSSGLSAVEVSRSLAQEVAKFLGLDPDPNAPENFAPAVLEGISKEILEVMIDGGLIEKIEVDISEISTRENVTHVNRYRPATITDGEGKKLRVISADSPIREFPAAIETAVLLEPEAVTYIGEAPKAVAATQLRSDTPTTDEQREVIRKEQAVEHRLNVPFIDTITEMGEDLVLRLFGGGDTSVPLNVNDKRSLEGQNFTVQSAYRQIQTLKTEVSNVAGLRGSDLGDTPVHYAYAYTVVNRLQMLGKDNPQSNKLMREAVLPTWDTLDLTDPDNRIKFSLGLAQALGVKVHTLGSKDMLKALSKKLEGFKQTLDILTEGKKLTADDVDVMKAEGVDSPVALHALMEYTRLQKTPVEGRKAFRTALYFEADGVTNGVVNAMSLFTAGRFTPEWISNIERGGLWIGEQAQSLADLRSRPDDADKDLYQVAADGTSVNVQDLLSEYQGTDVSNQIRAVLALLNEYLPGIDYDRDSGLQVQRGATKNPLTITIYGSGPSGIAGNLLDEVLTHLYAQMSTAAQRKADNKNLTTAQALFGGDPESAEPKLKRLEKMLTMLVGNQLAAQRTPDGNRVLEVLDGPSFRIDLSDFETFTVGGGVRKIMQDNILHAFVEPMVDAITATVGSDLIKTMDLIKTQTQSWSLVGQFMYQNAYEKALKAKRAANPDMNSYELLSRAESDAILKQVEANLPKLSTGTQNFSFGGRQKLDLPFMTSKNGNALKLEFSRSLTDGLETPAYGFMPGDAGVSGQPIMTIGNGDGQAIQNMVTDPEIPDNHIQIFDGIHSTVRELDQMGLVANRGVFTSWQRNPLMELAKAFNNFVAQVDLSSLNDKQLEQLGKSVLSVWEGTPSTDEIMDGLRRKAAEGLARAEGVSKRQAVLSQVQLSVDQMAGAATPFFKEGVILSGSPKQKAASLNQMLDQQVPAPNKQKEEKPVEAAPTSEVPAEPSRAAVPEVFAKAMEKMIVKITSDKLARALLRDVIRSGAVNDYSIHTGTREEILQRAADMGISVPADRAGTIKGFMVPDTKSIFVIDGNSETMLHELIHAATFEKLEAYYNNQNTNPELAEAVGRLEKLMVEFKAADLGGIAYQNAMDEMERQAAAGNQAAELNEFMAWALSNPDLASQLSEKKAPVATRIARAVVRELKKLLFGGKRSAAVKDDLFSNIRFNTSIVMRSGKTEGILGKNPLYHDVRLGDSDRLAKLLSQIKAKLTDYSSGDQITKIVNDAQARKSLIRAASVKNAFTAAGFTMTMQEQVAFMHLAGIMGTAATLDPNATQRMQDIYSHIIKQLSVDDFLRNPDENDSADNEQANLKFNLLAGKFVNKPDMMDRSMVLPAFVALAISNDEFRQILSRLDMPKGNYESWNSVDNILDNLGDAAMNAVNRAISGEGILTKDARLALDNLVAQMLETDADAELWVEKFSKPVGSLLDRTNEYVVNGFAKLADASLRNAQNQRTKNPNAKLKIALAETLHTLSGLLHEPTGHETAINMMSAANGSKIYEFVHAMMNDLTGRTTENAPVYDLIKVSRQWISGIRQQYVEEMPKIINGKFNRELSDFEKEAMHKGLAQTDMASLLSDYKIDEVLSFIQSPSKRDIKIKALKSEIERISPRDAKLILEKADQLADWMVNRRTGTNLLRNANAIAHLLGENVVDPVVSDEMVKAIDHLVSLNALSRQGAATLNPLSSLVHGEAEGLDFVLNLMRGQREIDMAKASGNAHFNHYKGYMAASTADAASLVVAYDGVDDNSPGAKKLLGMGYVRLGPLQGSERDPSAKNRSYWYAPVSGRSGFSQGISQNVQQTVSGVDAATGFTLGLTGGAITDPKFVQRISRLGTKESYGAALLPIYNADGKLTGYERQVSPVMLDKLKPDLDLPAMIGVRSGRQMEEANSFEMNKTLVDRLRDVWDRDRKGRSNEFIDLFKSTDPVHEDAVRIMSREMRQYVEARFPEGFMVRRDMINDAIGYRNASVGDAWTGTSRWSPETQRHVRQTLMGMFGNKAYVYMTKAETFLQNVIVQDIRTMIVIKSVIVPVANAVSNVYQLIGRGVPMVNIFRDIPKKTSEVESWHKTRIRQMEAEAELLAETDTLRRRKLEAEIQTIKDSHKRLSIWPLLEAGEFSSISDAGSREDVMLTEGRLSDYIERLVDKLPPAVKTAGKYAIISKDTALFRGLQKTVDYGDFVAKAILYDDMVRRQKKSKQEALALISEEFVNYDRLPGRDRQYLESIGLLWFWNFKIRSTKVAMSMIRNNPIHALLSINLPTPIGGIGMPVQDALPMTILDGRAWNSMGLHMMFRAPGLLPLGNIF